MLNVPCLISALFLFTGNLLSIIFRLKERHNFDFKIWSELDPDFIKDEWLRRQNLRELSTAAGLLGAFGWFTLCVPMIQVAWILSRGGRKRVGMHLLICAFAIAGSIAELLSRLMVIGVENASDWMTRSFNLDDWLGANSGDGLGWRTLEVVHFITFSIVLWVDAFMWLALSGILITIFFSIRADKETHPDLGRWWSTCGFVIGVLSLLDFLAYALRFMSWRFYAKTAIFLSAVNMLVLLPVWLIVLSYQLPKASIRFENDAFPGEEESFVNERSNQEEGVELS